MLRRIANGQGQKLGLSIELGERYTTYYHSFCCVFHFLFFFAFFSFSSFFLLFHSLFRAPPFCNLSNESPTGKVRNSPTQLPKGSTCTVTFSLLFVVFQILENEDLGTHTPRHSQTTHDSIECPIEVTNLMFSKES